MDRSVQGHLPADQWVAVVDLVSAGAAEVERAREAAGFLTRRLRKSSLPALPPPAWTFEVAPLLRVLAEDAKAGAPLGLRADLRGSELPEKIVRAGRLPDTGRRLRIDETLYLDRWLTLDGRLDDGTRVSIEVTDRLRHRKIRRSSGGKTKWKTKEKRSRRIDVEVAAKAETHDLLVPSPPPRVAVYSKPGASRPTAMARVEVLLPRNDGAILVLRALADVHRHLRPRDRDAA